MKPILILDQHWRKLEELFSPAAYKELQSMCTIIGGVNWAMDEQEIDKHIENADFLVASLPTLSETQLKRAKNLKAVIEVSGAFRPGLDYHTCFEHNIEVLSCSPGFQYSVAEMALAMILSGARGLVNEHENFRNGSEHWLDDNIGSDFTLYGQSVGFIGYGAIARELSRLMQPFSPSIKAYDPWLQAQAGSSSEVDLCDLDELVSNSKVLIVAASPTDENHQMINAELIEKLPRGALVLVISRAHLVDFDALVQAAKRNRIRLATDVFPVEPLPDDSDVRQIKNVILSPHRAAAVEGGRHPIGEMIVHDVRNILEDKPGRRLKPATPEQVFHIINAPDSASSQ
ncbi:putative 2-hydroxyacid dehydrogenase [Vibrio nigripulchritudo SFn27]|uniref:Putative 2-hydroxyacid dehydrogenase n=1 Tax=Vibrio nigripulchritudo TaxID=28173 RepID=U4K9V5_9VIBR|nr:NAD(P)-dependent oxidoreductase [Vibrio nigripulchritudo]CCN84299.1 putative 2-hydroxyacid dehydrogenase [Vibrio nigripulchritudo BLFn1]CCN89553.1 putative 2-hydroxyacid dehydrogenase [Vibrio nigripulchritudo SFn27]CCN94021.1 putative 2-hydroxyacid dehydrogenase [Vibrio nigripulchritudo ENn2]CCO43124.1 putative 2-hydroxyacid dehydrogenase [Vibrio nigripulchritudo SFn135]CCO55367.1 putative 2-hydroxyacid dehydrogenase [Vibrio nigripulchritudo Wn13]